jgi:hypothetical protein
VTTAREWIDKHLDDDEVLLADGYDDAIIGIGHRCGQPIIAVYDAERAVEILMERDGMDFDEAAEFFQFNTIGSWVGDGTPLFMYRIPPPPGEDVPPDPGVPGPDE